MMKEQRVFSHTDYSIKPGDEIVQVFFYRDGATYENTVVVKEIRGEGNLVQHYTVMDDSDKERRPMHFFVSSVELGMVKNDGIGYCLSEQLPEFKKVYLTRYSAYLTREIEQKERFKKRVEDQIREMKGVEL